MSGQTGDLREKIGRILATVEGLDERVAERQRDARAFEEKLSQDFRTFKHEIRGAQQVAQGHYEILRMRYEKIESRLDTAEQDFARLSKEFTDLRIPVDELVSLRKRLGALGIMTLSLITVLWAIVQPVWSFGAERLGTWLSEHWK